MHGSTFCIFVSNYPWIQKAGCVPASGNAGQVTDLMEEPASRASRLAKTSARTMKEAATKWPIGDP
ncbi:hypothetical protein [Pseudomonas sp. P97.38]|uniref:hypothetical protein n=1 Tax=Pseudomonas sp. P97.38 TaxID=255451 RepID=UPI0012EE990B|nr:hypothetical protein [Pseudomonas sp. P97.38]